MATVTIKFQNSLNWYIWFTSTSYQCWLNPLKTQAIFIILAVLVIKRVQRVLPKLHAKRAIIRTLTVTYCTLQKNKRSSVLNLPRQRQVCPSLCDLRHARRFVQACRERAFTFSIKFLWRVTFDHVYMIFGVTFRTLLHLYWVPHLNVNRPLKTNPFSHHLSKCNFIQNPRYNIHRFNVMLIFPN